MSDKPKTLSDIDLEKTARGFSPLNPAGAKILAEVALRAMKVHERADSFLAEEGLDGDTLMSDIDEAEYAEHFSSFILWGGEL